MDIFVNQEKMHPHPIFFLFWKENILVGPGSKHMDPIIYFLSFPPNQTHSKKVFLPIFSSKFTIKHYLNSEQIIHGFRLYHQLKEKKTQYKKWKT